MLSTSTAPRSSCQDCHWNVVTTALCVIYNCAAGASTDQYMPTVSKALTHSHGCLLLLAVLLLQLIAQHISAVGSFQI
jgi:hypothetical protein